MPLAILGFVGLTALAWAGAALIAVLAPARAAYGLGRVGRARRRVRKRLRALKKRVAAAAERENERRATWLAAARGFAERDAERRLAALPLESLRDEGAARVRWSALAEAGWTNVAETSAAAPSALAAAPGVGEASAERVAEAARAVAARERGREPDPPSPDAPDDRDLIARALVAAAERREVEPRSDAAGEAVKPLFDAIRPLARRSTFAAWLFRPGRRAEAAAALEHWVDGSRAAEAALDDAVAAEGRLQELSAELGAAPDLAARARASWADVEERLAEAWAELGLTPARRAPSAQGGLPDEIARRVEAFPLDATGLRVTLRRYQAFGARYLLEQERTLLGDEMGLGKTIQALAMLSHVWNQSPPDARPAFLIVAPAGLIWNWAREIEARAPFPVRVLHGATAEAELAAWSSDPRVGGAAVTSYATLRNLDVAEPLARLGERFAALIGDEAHYAKNPAARRTQALTAAATRARYVALLSGTPMENRPEELVHVVRVAQPAAADRLDADGGDPVRFATTIAGVYLRRNQTDVLSELPERIEKVEWVDLHAPERERYRAAAQGRNFAELRRSTSTAGPDAPTAKQERIAELLAHHREDGRKVLIFSFFLEVLGELERRIAPGELVGTISGAVAPEERMQLVDAFGAVDGHAVLLLQIDAGGTGLNLQAASAVILVEPQLKPTVEDQAIARAHRMGQTERVLVHRLIARDSVDEHLLGLVGDKRELFDAYARRSSLKDASAEATETSEAGLAKRILAAERTRLGLD